MSVDSPDILFLRRLADAAAQETMKYFRSNLAVDNKYKVGFDPVTEGDRRAEAAIRAILDAECPNHGILGEEFGAKNTDKKCVWVIDPIDGTRAYLAGVPVWGTLVGLMVDGHAKYGFLDQPYTREFYVADGKQTYLIEADRPAKILSTRQTAALKDAIIFTTSPFLFKGLEREGIDRLEAKCKLMRYGTDCYGAAMVASGHADIFIESGLKPYDIAALIPLIEQAGGIISRVDGKRPEEGGTHIGGGFEEALYEEALHVFLGA
ncbi:MAG: inositol monophosphatase family protein [Ahrensia sp.]|nr:inositol monophosphatase family protein [Ahrensia sp.]